jgi:hypothetical protein
MGEALNTKMTLNDVEELVQFNGLETYTSIPAARHPASSPFIAWAVGGRESAAR